LKQIAADEKLKVRSCEILEESELEKNTRSSLSGFMSKSIVKASVDSSVESRLDGGMLAFNSSCYKCHAKNKERPLMDRFEFGKFLAELKSSDASPEWAQKSA
jgi:hypothetical protein